MKANVYYLNNFVFLSFQYSREKLLQTKRKWRTISVQLANYYFSFAMGNTITTASFCLPFFV